MRCANMTTSSTIMPACTSHQPTPKSRRPCATPAWLTEIRFEETMKVNSANSRFAERPARGLTKLIGIASSTSTSAGIGMPTRHSSSPRFCVVGLVMSAIVGRFLCVGWTSRLSPDSMRAA